MEAFSSYQSPLSPYACTRFYVDGVSYSSLYQYIEAQKAQLFNKPELMAKILRRWKSYEIYTLSKENQENFDPDIWAQNEERILRKGLMAKYSTNKPSRTALLGTGDKQLLFVSKNKVTTPNF